MRKILFFLVATMMAACSNQEAIELVPSMPEQTIKSNIRSYGEALKIAQASISMLEGSNNSTRGEMSKRKIDLSENKVIKLDTKTRAEAGINDTLIYVFNFENNEGFAIVSASKATEGLLAVTEKGHYNPDAPSEIEGFNVFMELAKEYVLRTGVVPVDSIYEFKDSLISFVSTTVGPYVSVRWGQEMAEGEFCDNQRAGCTNVAFAQIMSYYGQPTSLPLTYCNGGNISLNWNNMRSHGTYHLQSSCSDLATHNSISHLLRELGKLNDSAYLPGPNTNTDAWTYAPITFPHFGYHVGTWGDYNGTYARTELDNGHIILANAALNHDWVFDGYIEELYTYQTYYLVVNHWVYTGNSHTVAHYYNHFNWGWYGINNGYYNEGVYNTSMCALPDDDCPQSYLTYNFAWINRFLSVYY